MNCQYIIFYNDTKIGVVEILKVKELKTHENFWQQVTDLSFRINNLNSCADLNDNQQKIPKIRVLVGPQQQAKYKQSTYEQLQHKKHGCILIDFEEEDNLRTVVVWNLDNKQAELKRYVSHLDGDYDIVWDNKGYPFIIQGDSVNMV